MSSWCSVGSGQYFEIKRQKPQNESRQLLKSNGRGGGRQAGERIRVLSSSKSRSPKLRNPESTDLRLVPWLSAVRDCDKSTIVILNSAGSDLVGPLKTYVFPS